MPLEKVDKITSASLTTLIHGNSLLFVYWRERFKKKQGVFTAFIAKNNFDHEESSRKKLTKQMAGLIFASKFLNGGGGVAVEKFTIIASIFPYH